MGVLGRDLPRYTRYTKVEPGRLVNELKEVRRVGLAYSKEEMTVGAMSVAAPIIAGGVLRGSLGPVVRASGKKLSKLTPALVTAALHIARNSF